MSIEPGESLSGLWTRWEGHVINGVYPLQRYLGCSDHSGVFLTECTTRHPSEVAIKLVPTNRAQAELQLPRWKRAGGLGHSHLLRLLEWGGCQLDGSPYLYTVMEYADQTLAQLLLHRALTEEEAREMLLPTLDALAFLHSRNLVQGQLKPANILVVGDQLKLASDTIRRNSEGTASPNASTVYDPPEARHVGASPAGDIWALGVSLLEALARRVPADIGETGADAVVPAGFSPVFRDVVASCLSATPQDRPSVADLTAWARGELAWSARAAPIQPSAPISPEPISPEPISPELGTPETALPQILSQSARPEVAPPQAPPQEVSQLQVVPSEAAPSEVSSSDVLSSEVLSAALSEVSLSHVASPQVAPSQVAPLEIELWQPAPPSEPVPPSQPLSPRAAEEPATPGTPSIALSRKPRALYAAILSAVVIAVLSWIGVRMHNRTPAALPVQAPAGSTAAGTPTSAGPAAVKPQANAAAPAPARSNVSASPSALHEVVPDVPRSARRTIRGHIKVWVRVIVEQNGSVFAASADRSGPSRYFQKLAVEAAKQWTFSPTDTPSRRLVQIRFDFTRDGATGQVVAIR